MKAEHETDNDGGKNRGKNGVGNLCESEAGMLGRAWRGLREEGTAVALNPEAAGGLGEVRWRGEVEIREPAGDAAGGGPDGAPEVQSDASAREGGAGPPPTDESLLVRLREGEPEALTLLWRRYAGLLYTQALGVLHNSAEAEDVVVEVFSEVWRRAAGYHPERARPVAWLVTLVRRRAIDRLRERRSYEKAGDRLARETRGTAAAAAHHNGEEVCCDGVEEQVHLAELRALLEKAMDALPESQKETVRLVYFHGLTQKEIAARTCTPLGTVKTRLELGLRKMRERIRGAKMQGTLRSLAP